jgi:hypothetical protein
MSCGKEPTVPQSGQAQRHPNEGDANKGFSYKPVNNKAAGNDNTHKRGPQG